MKHTQLIDPRYALRDDEIVVGDSYLKLLALLNQEQQYTSEDDAEDNDEAESEEPRPMKLLNQELLDIEYDKAQWLIDELVKSNYLVDVWVSDPESEDGGFWTSRIPQIGDIVQVPRDFKTDWESQEPCENRDGVNEMRRVNGPDINPFTPLGWEEEPVYLKITLQDILENKYNELDKTIPKTQAALAMLRQWGEILYLPAIKAWAKRNGSTPNDLFLSIAKDSRLVHPRFTKPWHYTWACNQIYVIYETKYNRVIGDQSLVWIKSVRDLLENIEA